jgi:surface protein
MFQGCSALTSLTINTTNFNTAKVTTMANMFNGCSSATSLPVTSFTTTAVTTMANMFYGCSKVTSLALTNFTTTAVTDMSYMFYNCSALTTLTVTSFNTAKVTNMTSMFQNCSAVTVLNVSNFNTAAVTNMSNMFNGCSKVTSLNLRNFNTDKVTSKDGMFTSCGSSSSSFTVNVANSTKASWVKATSSYPSYIDVIDWTTVVTGSDSVYYISLGTNLYKKLGLQSSGAYAKVSISVAGQDRTIGTSDDNLLSGRTAAMGGSIAVGTVYTAGTGSLTTSAYYTISGANSSYYVTAGSDGLLGTWDDVIKDGSGNGKLGTYDINATGTKIDMGWVFVKGSSVSKMLLASEYVLDSTAFNTSSSTATYANSTLFTTMASIYTKAGGTKTAILQNQSISMADYTGTVTYIYQCTTSGHTDSSGYHTATSGCSASITNTGGKATPTSAIKNQTNVTATFFALSMQEMAEAYNNDADYNVSADYRRAKYAACGSGNYNFSGTYNGTKIQAAYYWLRSPGHLSTYASYVSVYGYVDTLYSVSNTTIGARPACYATLVS